MSVGENLLLWYFCLAGGFGISAVFRRLSRPVKDRWRYQEKSDFVYRTVCESILSPVLLLIELASILKKRIAKKREVEP